MCVLSFINPFYIRIFLYISIKTQLHVWWTNTPDRLQRGTSLTVCTLSVLFTHPRFHRANLKHIRLLECWPGDEREACRLVMLCGGRLVATLSHPSHQETLSSLIRNRTCCSMCKAPADIFSASYCINGPCDSNASYMSQFTVLLISMPRDIQYSTIHHRANLPKITF